MDLKGFRNYLIEEELSENTIESYMVSVTQFFEFADEVTKANIIEWKRLLMGKVAPKTVNLRLVGILKYCDFLGTPMKIKRVKIQKSNNVENVITIEHFNRLIEGMKTEHNDRWLANYLILGKTGARVSEARELRKKDLERGYAELFTKGKVRRIYLPQSLKDEIWHFYENCDDDTYLIQSRYGGKISTRGIAQALNRHAEKYGIPKEVAHPHSFRHMFAIEFLKRNNNISLLADVLGHSGVNTTMIYLRLSQEQQTEAINTAVNW